MISPISLGCQVEVPATITLVVNAHVELGWVTLLLQIQPRILNA
jgi:hypothetical protein